MITISPEIIELIGKVETYWKCLAYFIDDPSFMPFDRFVHTKPPQRYETRRVLLFSQSTTFLENDCKQFLSQRPHLFTIQKRSELLDLICKTIYLKNGLR